MFCTLRRSLGVDSETMAFGVSDVAGVGRLWKTYCEHRTETCLPGVKACSDIKDWLKAKRKLNGEEDREDNPEDDFVVRKGVRVYLKDKPQLRPALKDKDK